jgi:hypothetical protein
MNSDYNDSLEERVVVKTRTGLLTRSTEWVVFFDPPGGNRRTIAILDDDSSAQFYRKGFINGLKEGFIAGLQEHERA